jgi:hypothetical protein
MNHLVDHRFSPFFVRSIYEDHRLGEVLIKQSDAVAAGNGFVVYEADGGLGESA